MSRKNKRPLAERVNEAAQRLIAVHEYVSPIDVLLQLGWLDGGAVARWEQGREECLEPFIQSNPLRLSEAMELLREWTAERGLSASETPQLARTPQRQTLRFSREGKPAVEAFYRTRWLSSALSEKKRERLEETAKRGPDLLVIVPRNTEWKCHRCGRSGDLLIMEPPGPACLDCAGLGDLEFLPAGDALLTRRVKLRNRRSAVVVRWSRTRKRYERQGLMVEPKALAQVQRELEDRRREEGVGKP